MIQIKVIRLIWNMIKVLPCLAAPRGTKVWLWRDGCGFDPTWRNEIFSLIYISFYSLWCRGEERRWVPPLNTQCLQNSVESGEQSVSLNMKFPLLVCWMNICFSVSCGIRTQRRAVPHTRAQTWAPRCARAVAHVARARR